MNSFVKNGDLLCTIDPQPFQVLLVEAQSKLATTRTTLVQAQGDLARIEPLAEIDVVSKQDADNAMVKQAAARSTVQAAFARDLRLITALYMQPSVFD